MMNQVAVTLQGNGQGSVRVNGEELQGVVSVTVNGRVAHIPTVHIELLADDVTVEAESVVEFAKADEDEQTAEV
jgi:hypothetical protein